MTRTLITAKPVSTVAATTARLSIASGVLFVLLLGSLHLLEPEFDPTWRFVSEYALGDFGWIMRVAFIMLATSLASASVALTPQIRTVVGYIGIAALGIAALGLFMAAVFLTDPIATDQANATFSGRMHVLGASLDYTPVAALLISIALARTQTWRPIRARLFLTTGVMLVAMVALILLLPHDGKFGPGVLAGLCGRFMLVSYLGWLATVGFHILKLHRRADASDTMAARPYAATQKT